MQSTLDCTLFLGNRKRSSCQGERSLIDMEMLQEDILLQLVGTPFEMRSLPAESIYNPYHRYEVVEPIKVQAGKVAPWFDQPGGGTQYRHPEAILDLLEKRCN